MDASGKKSFKRCKNIFCSRRRNNLKRHCQYVYHVPIESKLEGEIP